MSEQVAAAVEETAPGGAAPEGGAPTPAAPFELTSIPEDVRGDWYAGLESHLGELSQVGERWKPYEELGIHDIAPEQLSNLFTWLSSLEDPTQAEGAIRQLAESVGVDLTPPAPAAAPAATDDPSAALAARLDELQQRLDQREQAEKDAQTATETRDRILGEWEQVRAAHKQATGQDLEGELLDQVKALAKQYAYDNDTPIQSAYDFIMKLSAGAQQALVREAPRQPTAAEPAGTASTTAAPVDSFDEAEKQMRQRRLSVA